ncbi:MAG: hypothetical protein WD942_07000 [Dehalococcoidia bacterium]
MNDNLSHARTVIARLQEFERRIDAITNRLDDKRSVSQQDKEYLQSLLKSLKSDIRAAARRAPTNHYEEAYLVPAVTNASAHLTIATNSHPTSSGWSDCLYEVRLDINHVLSQIEHAEGLRTTE